MKVRHTCGPRGGAATVAAAALAATALSAALTAAALTAAALAAAPVAATTFAAATLATSTLTRPPRPSARHIQVPVAAPTRRSAESPRQMRR